MVENPESKDDYGWFEDVDPHILRTKSCEFQHQHPLHKALSIPPPVTEPPSYILESSLETQQLWYVTAGQRPKQPSKEREHFERLWSQNFESSSVKYSPASSNSGKDMISKSEFNVDVILKGKSPFSNSVSKSFANDAVTSLTVQIPQFRVVNSPGNVKYAEFLVVVSIGSHSSVTFGVWKRHSDFSALAQAVCEGEASSSSSLASPTVAAAGKATSTAASTNASQFKNSSLSWQCVLQRKKWFKCLDREYLSLKCFLLERFMHDLLFESPSSTLIITFLGLVKNNDSSSASARSSDSRTFESSSGWSGAAPYESNSVCRSSNNNDRTSSDRSTI